MGRMIWQKGAADFSLFDILFPEIVRNPQTESFLELLELPYLLDGTLGLTEVTDVQASSIQQGK